MKVSHLASLSKTHNRCPWCALKEEKPPKEKLLCMHASFQNSFPSELSTCQMELCGAAKDFFELIQEG